MRKQSFGFTLIASIYAFLVSTIMLSTSNAQQPNIVFIVVDDAGYADFGFMGSSEIPTPNLDALAANGVTFTQAHTGQACSPSRAAFLTGRHYNHFGYEANLKNTDDPLTEHFEGIPNSAVTMFERLKTEGYSTSVTGKWHVGGLADIVENGVITQPGNRPPKQGVDHFIGFQAGGGLQEMFLNPDGTDNVSSYNANGKHWSNLWGDNTVDYIDQHYQDSNPFFIYTSFNDPHSPITQAPSFNDPRISHLSGQRKTYASEVLTIDDNVGKIIEKLNDPNGDGNQNDSIMDETMIVFLNDNGGVLGNSADNGDLRDQKGSPYDGGTRVPMFISGAGIDPSARGTVYDKLVHSIDLVPSMVAAAGGSIPTGEIDGVNLLPFANGNDAANPHNFIAARLQEEIYYRTNDWKLIKNGYAGDWELYDFSDINNQSEVPSDNIAAANPVIVADMIRQLTDWEVTIDKQRFPSTDESIGQFNLFDHFTFSGTSSSFSATNAWRSPSNTSATMRDRDSHNGTVFHFGSNNNSSYTANNDLQRMNELEFIANGFEFEGVFDGTSDQSATIAGLPVLLAKNLNGELPHLTLSGTRNSTATNAEASFSYNLNLNTQLYDDLEIKGDGDGEFTVQGNITEYRPGRTITKTGSSTVQFNGDVQATGGGLVIIEGTAEINSISTLTGDMNIATTGEAVVDGTIDGNVINSGRFVVAKSGGSLSSNTVNLFPTLGDGDIDSRNSNSKGDQDSEILVGSVSNATGTTIERVIRSILSFDLSSLPEDAQVSSASLTLQMTGNDSSSVNNISGNLEVHELLTDPVLNETGSVNVDWIDFDEAGGGSWTNPGGDLGTQVGLLRNAALPNPQTTSGGQQIDIQVLSTLLTSIENNLGDDALSLILSLPGEEADAANMTGDRDLYRFGSNQSSNASPAMLSIIYDSATESTANVMGDFFQDSDGSILFDISAADNFDQIMVGGVATLDGSLLLTLEGGFAPDATDTFVLLDADSLVGEFANNGIGDRVMLVDGSGSFVINYDVVNGTVTASDFLTGLAGDYNADGVVDTADYTVWRDNVGANAGTLLNDTDGGVIGQAQYDTWSANYGSSLTAQTTSQSLAVPEPSTFGILIAGLAGAALRRRA